jgi:uncharacterized protein (UPF0335 family)
VEENEIKKIIKEKSMIFSDYKTFGIDSNQLRAIEGCVKIS